MSTRTERMLTPMSRSFLTSASTPAFRVVLSSMTNQSSAVPLHREGAGATRPLVALAFGFGETQCLRISALDNNWIVGASGGSPWCRSHVGPHSTATKPTCASP